MVTGLNFNSVVGGADITFGDSDTGGGAYASTLRTGNTLISADIEIETAWISGDVGNLNSFSFQTYMHEIGHALGLGHAGNYNGAATYAENHSGDNNYLNDSWQISVMSYFSQFENTSVNASFAYAATPMQADILAVQALYGTTGTLRIGNTTYGEDSNAGGYFDSIDLSSMTFTIYDEGGIDWIKFKTETADMVVDLAEEGISSVGGEVNNMIIARGTIIENFFAGSGDDIIKGNDADNIIIGGSGDDMIRGFGGDDILRGNKGNDTLRGNDGNDTLYGNAGRDTLLGRAGDDILFGGIGRDLIWGGDGDDRLVGGRSMDKLIGGAGADTFVFNVGDGKDKIRDFEAGIDTLEIETGAWGSGIGDMVVSIYDVTNGYIQLEFSTGTTTNVIKLAGITDIADISGDFVFI